VTEKANYTREKEVREVMERDTLKLSFFFWLAILTLILLIASIKAHADTCEFYECPYGEVIYHQDGGVTFAKTDPKDCKLVGKGNEQTAKEFEANNAGKHLMIDCKKGKK